MIRSVVRKELSALWTSPLPYAVGVLFHVAATVLFVNQLEGRRQAVVQPLFPIAGFLLIALLPVLTMRAFSEERRTGQLDVLLAIPVRARILVIGKVTAMWLTAMAVIAPSALLVATVSLWGDPDWGPVLTGYLGLALLALGAAAIGVLASSLTSMQPVAAVVAFFVNLVLWFSYAAPGTDARGVVARLSFSERLRSFAGGALDTADFGYFVVLTIGCCAATVIVVDGMRST